MDEKMTSEQKKRIERLMVDALDETKTTKDGAERVIERGEELMAHITEDIGHLPIGAWCRQGGRGQELAVLARRYGAEPGRFGAPVNLQQEPLPMQATLSQDGEGSLAKISLSLDDLLGELDNGAIRYRFALTSSSAGARRTVSHLGILEVRIDADDYRLWSEHRLHIVVWTPGPASEVSLTEVPTGRTGRVPLISRAQPDETVALGRKLAVAPLLGGRGVAIAYFPTCPERHPNAEAILVLAADATPRMADPLPGGRLALALPESSQ